MVGLISLLGIVNHLTRVEWRWIDGTMRGEDTSRLDAEFSPGPELTVATAIAAYRTTGCGDRVICTRDAADAANTRRRWD